MDDKTQSMPSFEIRVEHQQDDGLPTIYANEILSTLMNGSFYLRFFEGVPGILLGNPDMMRAEVETMGKIIAKEKARIVVPPQIIPQLIMALTMQLATYNGVVSGNIIATKIRGSEG